MTARILVVDDVPANVKLMEARLSAEYFDVITALSGQDALAVCERVTGHLSDYRDRYSLEVSSPGQDRPLTKPQHFSRFLGRHARVRLRDAHDGRGSLTGELVGASERDVTIAAESGVVTIPYDQITRSNLVPGE